MEGAQTAAIGDGRYRIVELVGSGGQKRVYRAHDERLDRDVAVAIVDSGQTTPDGVPLTQWEARVMAELGDHPHIVTVHDTGEEDDKAYIVTEYMLGGDLAQRSAQMQRDRTAMPVEDVARLAEEMCLGLSHIHDHGLVHRDIRPQNVWLTAAGTAAIGDFDTSAVIGQTIAGNWDPSSTASVAHMSPELARGEPADIRSDLYSLGATLYHLLTDHPPFDGESPEVLFSVLESQPPPPSQLRGDVPEWLDTLVTKLLSKNPAQRPATAEEVRRILGLRRSPYRASTSELLTAGESATVEFKAAARYNAYTGQTDAEIEHAVVRSVAGFMNSLHGGVLLVGAEDRTGTPVGLSKDFASVKGKDRDGFEGFLTDLLQTFLGKPALARTRITFEQLETEEVCRVDVEPSDVPVYLRHREEADIYVRFNNSTRKLNTEEAVEYVRGRWGTLH